GLAELHDVHAVLAQGRSDRRRGGGLARGDLQFDDGDDLLGHGYTFSTSPKFSSTGVARPKIDTSTRTFSFSSITSSTTPVKSANGPVVMRTVDPFWNVMRYFGVSSRSCLSSWRTSASSRGTGRAPEPTKPVTPGVLRTTYHESSSMTISTRTYPEEIL